MNPTTETPIHNPTQTTKKSAPWPIIGAVAGAGLLAFFAGRATTPADPPASMGTSAEPGASSSIEVAPEAKASASIIEFAENPSQTAGVQLITVTPTMVTGGLPFNGEVEASPDRIVRVSSVVPGRITRLLVSLGDQVQKGQTLAIVESRAIGEAQSAYQQAVARFGNAQSNLNVVGQQARAGVFSRAPLEAARRSQVEAAADVRDGETAVRQGRVTLDNVLRQARLGTFASPALEAARAQTAAATESLRTAEAALSNARAGVNSAQSELERRRQLAAGGAYVSRPVQEAERALVAARSARGAAQSEVATTRANLSRAKSLSAEGLVSQRDLEAAQQAFDTATARLETAQSDETTQESEVARQQKLGASNVAGVAEIGAAQSALASAQSDVATRQAEAARARESVRLAGLVLRRERATFGQNIANRREVSTARGAVENAGNALVKARQTLIVANSAFERENRISRQGLNNTAQLQAARAAFVGAQSDLQAARTALSLLKSAPGGRASVPIVAPIGGTVQERPAAQGEVITADTPLMTIADLSMVHIDMFVPEREVRRVKIGAPITATLDALPGRTFTGRIELVHAQVDDKTRMVETHAEISNPGDIKPGMFARGRIQTGGGGQMGISVPAEAVQEVDGKKVVYVPGTKANSFEAREVVADAPEGGRINIKSGLRAGQRIVAKGAFMVKAQGMKSELAEE